MSFNVLNELETLGVIRFESLTGYISKGIINDKIFICIGDKLDVIKEYENRNIWICDESIGEISGSNIWRYRI